MLTKFAQEFMRLGEQISGARVVFEMVDAEEADSPRKELSAEEYAQLSFAFSQIFQLCDDLGLSTSKELFHRAVVDALLPQTGREFEIYITALNAEMKSKLFVFIPSHRQKFMQPRHFMAEGTKEAFPKAREEMANAGRSHAVGIHTAAVFHCMRAVEIGLRTMAIALDVKVGEVPLELADQEAVIRGIESKINGMKDRKKTAEKDDDLNFYSQAAMQFRYFKDGWRVRTAHTRATYEEGESLSVLEHAASFIDDLSKRLKEPVV
jgi:hypothetical protein